MPCPLPRRTRTGARVGCLPVPRGLPRFSGGSASATSLSRPAQALLTLRPVGLLDRPRRPLSRGFGPASCPSEPLVSYQRNRQLAGWNLPPLVNRAAWAHREIRASVLHRLTHAEDANAHVTIPFVPIGAGWIGGAGGCASASACAERA